MFDVWGAALPCVREQWVTLWFPNSYEVCHFSICRCVRCSTAVTAFCRARNDKTSPLTQTAHPITLYSVTRGHNTHLLQEPASDKVFKFWIFSAARQKLFSENPPPPPLPLRLQGQAASPTVFTGLMWSSLVQLLLQHIKVFLRLKGINYFVHLLTTRRSIGIQSERQKSELL